MAWNNSDKSDDRARLMREYDQMCGASHRRDIWLYLSVFVCIWTVALWFVFNKSIGNSSDQVAAAVADKSVERMTRSEDERIDEKLRFADGRKRRLSDLIRTEDLLAEEEFRHGSAGKGPPYDIWYEFCSSNDWDVSRDSFVIGHQGVGRSDVSSKEVRLFGDGIRFHGFPACEARVRFRDGRATDVFVSLFNKGDMKCLLRTSSAYRYIADFKGMMTGNGTPLSAPEKVSVGANEWVDYYVWTESIPKFILSCGYARTSNDVVAEFVVDSGLPLVWCVKKSLPFEERFFSDGHMRMIVGYNTDRQQILYTDSWGMGHELKRASIKKAFGVTEFCTCPVPSWLN